MIVYIYDANDFIANKPPLCIVSCDLIIGNNGDAKLSKNNRVFAKIKMNNEGTLFITDHVSMVLSNPPSDGVIEEIKKACL